MLRGFRKRATKKRKSVPSKSRKGKEPAIRKFVCDGKGMDPEGKEVQVGNHTLQELAQFMVDIPTDEEMAERQQSGLPAVLKRVVGHWGQVNSFLVLCTFKLFLILSEFVPDPGLYIL